jgi:hypothetical protein
MSEIINETGVPLGYAFPYSSFKIIRHYPRCIAHPSVMMRRDTLMEVGGYPPIKRSEDLFLWFELLKKGRVIVLEEPLIKYRITEDSLSSTMTDFYRENVNNLWRFFANKPDLCKDDFDYINVFIKQNILSDPNANRSKYARVFDNKLYSFFNAVFPSRFSFKLVFLLRNCYGRMHYRV